MKKVQIYKVSSNYYWSDEGPKPISNWLEIEDDKLVELDVAISRANMKKNAIWKYYLVHNCNESDFPDIFDSAQHYIDEVEKEYKREEERRIKYLAEKEEKDRARKIKQLEKLKKELENST